MSLLDNGKYAFRWKHLTLSDTWTKGKLLQPAECQKWNVLNNHSREGQLPSRYFKAMSKFANMTKRCDRSCPFRSSCYCAPACDSHSRPPSVAAAPCVGKFFSRSPGNRSASVTFEDMSDRSANSVSARARRKSPSSASASRSSLSSKAAHQDGLKRPAASTAAPPCGRTAGAAAAVPAGAKKGGSSRAKSPSVPAVSHNSPGSRAAGTNINSPCVDAVVSDGRCSAAAPQLTDRHPNAAWPHSDIRSHSAVAALRSGIVAPASFKSHHSTSTQPNGASSSVGTSSPNPTYFRNLQATGYLPPVASAHASSGDPGCRSDDLHLGSQSSQCPAIQPGKGATPLHVTPTFPVISSNQLTPSQKPGDMNVSKSLPRCDVMYLSMYRLGSNLMKPENSSRWCGVSDQQFQLGYFPSGPASSNRAFRSAWVETPSVSPIVFSESLDAGSQWTSSEGSDKVRADGKFREGAKINDAGNRRLAASGSSKHEPETSRFQSDSERSGVKGQGVLPSTLPADNELHVSAGAKKLPSRTISSRKMRRSAVQSTEAISLPRIENSLHLSSPRFSNTNNAALTPRGSASPVTARSASLAPVINAALIHSNDSALLKLKTPAGGVLLRSLSKPAKDKSPWVNQKLGVSEKKKSACSKSQTGDPPLLSEETQKLLAPNQDTSVSAERKCQIGVATSHGLASNKTASKPNSAKHRRRHKTFKVRLSAHGDATGKSGVVSGQSSGARFPAGVDVQSKKPANSGKRFPNGKKCRKVQQRANSKQSQKQQVSSSESKVSIDTDDEENLLRAKWAELKFLPSVNKLTEIPQGNDDKSGKKQKKRKGKQNGRSRGGGNKKKSGNKNRRKRVKQTRSCSEPKMKK